MPRIGSFLFPSTTLAHEKTEFVLDRVRRVLTLVGVLERFPSRAAYLEAVAELEREVERFDRGETDASIRTGRFLKGRRRKWTLVREDDSCLAAVSIEILAEDRFERSETETVALFTVEDSPLELEVEPGGNWTALPRIELTAVTAVSSPAFGDGVRTLAVNLDLAPGDRLAIDSETRTVLLNEAENVLGATTGEFPELTPGGATIHYADQTEGARTATLELSWRDRWV